MSREKMSHGTEAEEQEQATGHAQYTREQLLSAECLKERRDLVRALLDEEKLYSLEMVGKMIDSYMKGKVKAC